MVLLVESRRTRVVLGGASAALKLCCQPDCLKLTNKLLICLIVVDEGRSQSVGQCILSAATLGLSWEAAFGDFGPQNFASLGAWKESLGVFGA
jgi:hypothetical protein